MNANCIAFLFHQVQTGIAIAPADPAVAPPPVTQAHFVAFFAQFPEFQYDSSQPIVSEFRRLTQTPEWKSGINRRLGVASFKLALVLQFNATYGTDQNNLASWQNLCRVLRIESIPDELQACRKVSNLIFGLGPAIN